MEKKTKKSNPYFTRKNLMVIGAVMFYAIILIFSGLCLTASTTQIFAAENPILLFAKALGLKEIQINGPIGIIGLVLVALYIIVFVIALLYELRFAKINQISRLDYKMWITYAITFVSCVLLSYGVTVILLAIFKSKDIGLITQFLAQSLLVSLLVYLMLAVLVISIAMLLVNFILIDKPFKNTDKTLEDKLEDNEEIDSDVTSSFDNVNASFNGSANGTGALMGGSVLPSTGEAASVEALDDREKVFPGLYSIDVKYDGYPIEKAPTDDLTLEELCTKFHDYLAKGENIYFDLKTIRFFIAGWGATRLSILEGLSGTGKSSLPRFFAKFINAKVTFLPVQSTWRDKSSILGYFNDFTKTYSETDFLLSLYNANYNPDQINIFVLDEMNISRVEYYFADFLSILEYPSSEWKVRIMQLPYGFVPPAKLDQGYIRIPRNSYFVGTANKDDSTFSISDKVYDRAYTIYFDNRNKPFEISGDVGTIKLSNSKLESLYANALEIKANQFNKNDASKFGKVTDFIYEQFDVTFGNRILNQIEKIVPTYVACGGKKEEALDFILSRKIISKLDGRFEEYIKPNLKKLLDLIHDVYGNDVLTLSEKAITGLMRKL